MGTNLTAKRLLGGLTVTFLLTGCAAGATPSPSATEAATPAVAVATSTPTPALAPTPPATAEASSGAAGCVSLNIDYAPDARGKAGDLVGLARAAIAGLRAGDVVQRDVPTDVGSGVQIVRAGEVIGTVVYFPDQHGGWLLVTGYLCGGLGVSSEPEPSVASGVPAAPTGPTYHDDRGVAPDVTVTVAWNEVPPEGVSIWVYGVTDCLASADGAACVTETTKIPASALLLISKVPAATGTTAWTFRDHNIGGALGVYHDVAYYAIILRAVNQAGQSPCAGAGTNNSCSNCTY